MAKKKATSQSENHEQVVEPEKKGAGPGRKQCPECQNYIGARQMVCPECSYQFTPKEKKATIPRVNAQTSYGVDFESTIRAERDRIQSQLENRDVLQKRLEMLDELLETFKD